MAEKTVPDYLQNEMTLKKINSILKEKNHELEIKINHLSAENSELKEKTKLMMPMTKYFHKKHSLDFTGFCFYIRSVGAN
ncbi:hypothetical protein NKOR_05955 [Candidatus Nitrosopumilus koreensis AR1]|uniref:Uncharacterized protein n=1 Tax=Candidatus Nitrosopumilus koreensis AR1 TaxID=1229908 RepID=K0B6G6_9ARCH|nr:hypothetical protein [Candidatus Nitrosopumilus koreensis]AFS81074.1 hypothetical protein NKOR_05955 [Candidatus Nitrosopumilus koreensis AR1]